MDTEKKGVQNEEHQSLRVNSCFFVVSSMERSLCSIEAVTAKDTMVFAKNSKEARFIFVTFV